MGIRETLNQKPGITTGATAAIIVIALGLIVYQMIGGGSGSGTAVGNYFTIDDGKTFFVKDGTNVPPFEYKGKTAYQAFVWSCDGGKTRFVSHLQRYTAEGKKRLEALHEKGPGPQDADLPMVLANATEIKLVGNGDDPKNWLKQTDPRASSIMEPKCPGGTGQPEPMIP